MDAETASSRIACSVRLESPLAPDGAFAGMARLQGGGVARRSELGTLDTAYVKRNGAWAIERSTYRPA